MKSTLFFFLFLITAEGLIMMMNEALGGRLFKGFELERQDNCVSHLQFVNYTLIIC